MGYGGILTTRPKPAPYPYFKDKRSEDQKVDKVYLTSNIEKWSYHETTRSGPLPVRLTLEIGHETNHSHFPAAIQKSSTLLYNKINTSNREEKN